MGFNDKIWEIREKYDYKTPLEILKLKESAIKEKLFCLIICLIYFPIMFIIWILFIISYLFYKLNKWCRWELDLDD